MPCSPARTSALAEYPTRLEKVANLTQERLINLGGTRFAMRRCVLTRSRMHWPDSFPLQQRVSVPERICFAELQGDAFAHDAVSVHRVHQGFSISFQEIVAFQLERVPAYTICCS